MNKTETITIKAEPGSDALHEAAEIIKSGGLVAFPTETVYGLGANALLPSAIKKIYAAKGRPSDNPLIAHIGSLEQLSLLAEDIPKAAKDLIDRFWPGPLTLIFDKKPHVPRELTGGLDTVAVRFPSHPVARAFLALCDCPVAAPSANRSGRPSPTTAAHVFQDMNGVIPMILDGGSCDFGVESTIVDVRNTPRILRPGSITRDDLLKVTELAASSVNEPQAVALAPGMKYTHYAPKAPLTVVSGDVYAASSMIVRLADRIPGPVGILASEEGLSLYCGRPDVICIGSRKNPESAARNLYAALREMDERGVSAIYSESFEEGSLGETIMNRLLKAAGYSVICAK